MNSRLDELRKKALDKHIPVMRPKTAELLSEELKRQCPKKVLEIGTCIGLGVITMLLNGAEHVTSIEIDEERYFEAKKNIEEFGFSLRAELILGDCKEIIPMMDNNRYDFIVLDGPKSFYADAYPYLKMMLTPSGEIFIDDTSFYGLVNKEGIPVRKHRTNVLCMRDFLNKARNDKCFNCREYEIEDGVMILSNRESQCEDHFSF